MNDVLVAGAGAWGTALAIHAARAGRQVTLWARDPVRAALIAAERVNPLLPGAVLPPAIRVVTRAERASLLLLAVPMQQMRRVTPTLPPGPVVVCAKGVESSTGLLPLEMLASLRPGPAAILTGPNFAGEIAAGLPAAAVIASSDQQFRHAARDALGTQSFRLYSSDDVVGAQLGGAAKNVIAIAAGVVIGAGLGENARAALVTRGLAELARLVVASGGRVETASGLSGLGDLLLTCTGLASRNFRFGIELGRGRSASDILATLGTVEGIATAPALVVRAAACRVSLPICAAVAGVLKGELTLAEAMTGLQSRPLRDE